MKCLEKDRGRRYETANGLAADLKRHLGNEPVVARPPSAAYRLQKLVRRNKLAVAAVTSVAAVLVLGVIASTWQAVRATQAKREAVEAQRKEMEQRESSDKNAEKARQSEQKAEAQQKVAVEQRKLADMQLALQAWEEGDLQRAKDLIDASRPAPAEIDISGARVLVAEDHPTNQKVVELILEAVGVTPVIVENGQLALDALKAERFDVVLMDMQMPELDGLSATIQLRAWEAAEGRPRTPVIMVTANALDEHVRASDEAGADLHLSKPIHAQALIESILAAMTAASATAEDSKVA